MKCIFIYRLFPNDFSRIREFYIYLELIAFIMLSMMHLLEMPICKDRVDSATVLHFSMMELVLEILEYKYDKNLIERSTAK
jgi:hypothetical protein